MKITRKSKIDIVTTVDYIDNDAYVFAMANIKRDVHGGDFVFWVDESGKNRNVQHNAMRYKATDSNGVEVIFQIPSDESPVILDRAHSNKQAIDKFKVEKEVLSFMEEFRSILIMHWDRDISTQDLINIIQRVKAFRMRLPDAINSVLFDDLYSLVHRILKQLSEVSEEWKNRVFESCYYNDIRFIGSDASVIRYAKNLLNSVNESFWNTEPLNSSRNILIDNIQKYDRLINKANI